MRRTLKGLFEKSPLRIPKNFSIMKMNHLQDMCTPQEYATRARENFLAGYGCAQAVLLAFADVTALDTATAAALASSFGGGMGRMREVCGAVSGALMVLGLAVGYTNPQDTAAKSRHYALVREFAARFKARCTRNGKIGSIVCRDLLAGANLDSRAGGEAEARTPDYYRKRPCPDLCALAAEVAAELVQEMLNDVG